jgi:hypothetical protein
LEDFRFRIAKELESKELDPDKLEQLEAALLDGIVQEPDAFLLMQGTTPDQLAGMSPEPDPSIARGVLDAAAANGGVPPTGTGAAMAYVIGPDGTVYRRGTDGVDRDGLGLMGTLNEIRGQHIAATGKKHADDGNTGALIDHALDQGALDLSPTAIAVGAFGATLIKNKGTLFAPADRLGGGAGGRKAADHGKNERHGDGGKRLEAFEKKLEELQERLANATTRRQKVKIRNQIKRERRDAERARVGEEHSRGGKP